MKKKFIIDAGKRILKLRRSLNLEQKEMAHEIGISPGYLSDIEKGKKTNPGFAFLYLISKHYRVSLDYLVHGIGDMFLKGKESEEQRLKDFSPGFETIDDLTWLIGHSPFSRNTIMGFAIKFFKENEDIIKWEMLRLSDKKKDKPGEPGPGNTGNIKE